MICLHILAKFFKNRWRGFFVKSQKRVFFKKKERFSRNWGTKLKKRLGHFLSSIGPLLHAKFQKNRWSGFRVTAVTHVRTYESDSIGPFGFQPGTKKYTPTRRKKVRTPPPPINPSPLQKRLILPPLMCAK